MLEECQVLQWMFFEQYSHEPNIAVARYWLHFLAGDGYCIADIALYAYTHVADEAEMDLGPYPGIRRWLDRVAEQPGHVLITQEDFT